MFNEESQPTLSTNGGLPRAADKFVVSTNHSRVWLAPLNSNALLRDAKFSKIVTEATGSGIVTIVDTPAASMSTDAFLIAQRVGHALYVVRHQSQDLEVHRQVREQLERLNVRILGIVVNDF